MNRHLLSATLLDPRNRTVQARGQHGDEVSAIRIFGSDRLEKMMAGVGHVEPLDQFLRATWVAVWHARAEFMRPKNGS